MYLHGLCMASQLHGYYRLKIFTTRGLEVSIHPPKYFQKLESLANVGTEPSLQPLSWK